MHNNYICDYCTYFGTKSKPRGTMWTVGISCPKKETLSGPTQNTPHYPIWQAGPARVDPHCHNWQFFPIQCLHRFFNTLNAHMFWPILTAAFRTQRQSTAILGNQPLEMQTNAALTGSNRSPWNIVECCRTSQNFVENTGISWNFLE